MCGSYFKSLCKYSVQDYTDARNHRFLFKIHEKGDPSKIFCKAEYLNHFLQNFSIEQEFDLLTHNSDINVNAGNYENAKLLQPNLRMWYAQNLNCDHPMMRPLPIGLANPKWEHGNQQEFQEVQDQNLEKRALVDVSFDLYTNLVERQKCLDLVGLPMRDRLPFKDHLRKLSSSFFCVSPEGNGLDCHRHWEALYLRTVPIVTRSSFTELLQDFGLPVLIIKDWTVFKKLELTPSLYYDMTKNFDWKSLNNLFLNSSP